MTVILILSSILYFLPTIVAISNKQQVAGVLVINFFLGWTFVGWVIALAWAVSKR